MHMEYTTVIGLECHAQLQTQSKLFCGCPTRFGESANYNTCPVCLGLPGALPVLNRGAVRLAMQAALGFECRVNLTSQWARKNYFYPDLPKGYQISQFDRPLAQDGHLDVCVGGKERRIRIQRIHMEEDAGKSLHDGFPDSVRTTYIDLNRSGTPLIEIVTYPDLRSSDEAQEYMARLREILEFLGVCDGNMEEGSLRCDANVSVCRIDSNVLGTRTELKNINSFKFLGRAIDYEVERQIDVIESGGTVIQETRLWNDRESRTLPMRSKEEAHDYRYFPEPDLPPLALDQMWVDETLRSLPELPAHKRARFMKDFGLSDYDANVLTSTRSLSEFFEAAASGANPKEVANWVMGDLMRLLKEDAVDLKDLSSVRMSPEMLTEMVQLVTDGTISGKIAKSVIEEMYRTGRGAALIVEEEGLKQISDDGELDRLVDALIAKNPEPVEQYRAGKRETIGWFVGQIMKATQGKANPKSVNELLRDRLARSDH